jgi:hypothetical protein
MASSYEDFMLLMVSTIPLAFSTISFARPPQTWRLWLMLTGGEIICPYQQFPPSVAGFQDYRILLQINMI